MSVISNARKPSVRHRSTATGLANHHHLLNLTPRWSLKMLASIETVVGYMVCAIFISFFSRPLMVHSGLRVAEIHVIFTLPPHLGAFPHPLAYVHWFTPIRVWDNEVGMYRMGRSTRNHKPHAAVVSVNHILHTCHLMPRFGSGPVPRSWFKGRVLDLASDFYLNRYINFFLFKELHPSHREQT